MHTEWCPLGPAPLCPSLSVQALLGAPGWATLPAFPAGLSSAMPLTVPLGLLVAHRAECCSAVWMRHGGSALHLLGPRSLPVFDKREQSHC